MNKQKTILTAIMVAVFLFMPRMGYTEDLLPLMPHFIYPFSHANVWHLAANILCLWCVKCRMYAIQAYIMAVMCSFFPEPAIFHQEPTMGFSGVLFAMVGISWGQAVMLKMMFRKNWVVLVVPFFIPHVNALIHIYCLFAGYVYGSICRSR